MFEPLVNFYTELPWIIREAFYVVFVYGIFRRYVAKDIETEMDKRGLLKDGLFHTIVRNVKLQIARHIAIWKHYGTGHPSQSVLACGRDKCTVFNA